MLAKITFFHTRPHPPPASAATATDRVQEQVGHARRAQQLHDDRGWHGLPHPPKGSCDEGERLRVPQVRGEVRPALRAGGGLLVGKLVWIQGPYPAGKY
jgi:hypothetical protein